MANFQNLSQLDVLAVIADLSESDRAVHQLREGGFSVGTAQTLAAARQTLAFTSCGVVLLDLNMKGSEAIHLPSWRTLHNVNSQIILLADPQNTFRAIQAITQGAAGHLPLPLHAESLLLQVKHSLQTYRDRQQLITEGDEIEAVILQQTIELQQMHAEVMHLLSVASCYRDHETGTHNQRVGMVSSLLAKASGWSDVQAEELRLAALMHDIGKLAIPDAILRKPGKLTESEYRLMQKHTILGDEILSVSKLPVLELSRQIALSHHERWDGGGYPFGLNKNRIPESARIVAIADVYDALTHDRIYRPAMPEAEALGVIQDGRGTHFDPHFLEVFFDIREEVRHINATIVEAADDSDHKQAIWDEIKQTCS